jgi:hypothetical protein
MTLISNVMQGVANYGWYVVALAIATYMAKIYHDYDRLKDFKGPWLGGWTSLWLMRAVSGLQTHAEFARVCKKYGM